MAIPFSIPPRPFPSLPPTLADVKSVARRNERLKHASLTPLPDNHHLQIGPPARVASATMPGAVPSSATFNSSATVGRHLLSRQITYADISQLPSPQSFQLHEPFKGWNKSPQRLDLLHKELIRERNVWVR